MGTERIGDEGAIQQLSSSLQKLVSFERFHLHKPGLFQNTSRDPAFDTRYLPQSCGALRLPCFWVLRRCLYVYGCQMVNTGEMELFEGDGLQQRVLLPIHPASLDIHDEFLSHAGAKDAAEGGLRIWAVPTASARTFLAWPDQAPEKALFLKTSLHSAAFGDRRLLRRKVGCSVGLSKLVQDSLANLSGPLTCFAEPVGLVPRSMQDSGAIARSIPREIKDDRLVVAPLFSLLGGDENHSPLFLTILERTGMPALQFLEDVLCSQFARLWLEMSLRFGLILESHGQDLMLALSPDLAPLGRFFYRDFEGLQVDWELRHRRRLPVPENMPHAWAWHDTYATWGYRYSGLVWYKLRISLFQYLHMVLNELDLSLCEWQKRGLIKGPKFERDDVTMIFSREMMKAVQGMFGIRVEAEYNIYRSLNRFMIFLMRLRRELLARE